MKFKIRNTKDNVWIPLSSCYWKAKDLFPEVVYDFIEMVPSIGVVVSKIVEVEGVDGIVKSMSDVYLGDIVTRSFEKVTPIYYEIINNGPRYSLKSLHDGHIAEWIDNNWVIVGNVYDNPDFLICV